MNSANMGDTIVLISRHKCKINMVEIAQENRTDADTDKEKKGMKKNTHEAVI